MVKVKVTEIRIKAGESPRAALKRIQRILMSEIGRVGGSVSSHRKIEAAYEREAKKRKERAGK